MKLPSDEVGISDILDYRECPQRMAFGMRRHVELPERFQLYPGEKDEPPESTNDTNAYGSAVHDAIQHIEETACSDEDAINAVWPTYQHWLMPSDIDRFRTDLETYHTRSEVGYRVVGAELELKMPLFQHEGRWIWFRGRIDVLYQHLQNSGLFLSRDYKSSRFPRSAAEVHDDLQQWAYNALIHYNFPECESLTQQYDQLRFGSIPTHKSQAQRSQIFQWLVKQVRAIMADELMKPQQNKWCQTCPLKMDCRVTHLSTDWWKNRIAALAPEKKEGRKIVVQLTQDIAGIEEYVQTLPKAKDAKAVLDRFIGAVEELVKDLPDDERRELGYELGRGKALKRFTATGLRQAHEIMGDDLFQVASITKQAVEDFYGAGSPEAETIMALAESRQSAPSLKAARS